MKIPPSANMNIDYRNILRKFFEITDDARRHPKLEDFPKRLRDKISSLIRYGYMITGNGVVTNESDYEDELSAYDLLLNFDNDIILELKNIENMSDDSSKSEGYSLLIHMNKKPPGLEIMLKFDLIRLEGKIISITDLGKKVTDYDEYDKYLLSSNEANKSNRIKDSNAELIAVLTEEGYYEDIADALKIIKAKRDAKLGAL